MIFLVVIAIILDLILGDPLWFPHPIIYIGKLISFFEKRLYHKANKIYGLLIVLLTVGCVWGVLELILYLSQLINISNYIIVFFLYTSLAIKSLAKAGRDVSKALSVGISDARLQLSYIVGRDTARLSEQEIIKGTVETIAENTIDGIIAPLFYMIIGLLFNAPLQMVFLYKTINTLDSMVGYKNDKYSNFGYFSAKIDDILNFIPARIGSFIMLIAGLILRYDFRSGLKIYIRDRFNHKSPNSAHPESVVAGLLNLRLGGPAHYFGKLVDKQWIGDDTKIITKDDIAKTNKILYISVIFIAIVLMIVGVVI